MGSILVIVIALAVLGAAACATVARTGWGRTRAFLGVLGAGAIAAVPVALRDDPAIGLVGPAWMFAVVWSTDIIAYFTGRTFGGPKLMPKVSPKKTWSGALGGLLAATLAGTAVVAYGAAGVSAIGGRAADAEAVARLAALSIAVAMVALVAAEWLSRRVAARIAGR